MGKSSYSVTLKPQIILMLISLDCQPNNSLLGYLIKIVQDIKEKTQTKILYLIHNPQIICLPKISLFLF